MPYTPKETKSEVDEIGQLCSISIFSIALTPHSFEIFVVVLLASDICCTATGLMCLICPALM